MVSWTRSPAQHEIEPAFDKMLKDMLQFTVPFVHVEQVYEHLDNYILLDTRDQEEYDISHIKGARRAGYDDFNLDEWTYLEKDKPIVLYCSVGYRSEKIGERFLSAGYHHVYNLYGSIFAWVNKGYPVVKSVDAPTKEVHTYNRRWSKWVINNDFKKRW